MRSKVVFKFGYNYVTLLATRPVSITIRFITTMLCEKWSKKNGMVGTDRPQRQGREDITRQNMKIPMMQKVSRFRSTLYPTLL